LSLYHLLLFFLSYIPSKLLFLFSHIAFLHTSWLFYPSQFLSFLVCILPLQCTPVLSFLSLISTCSIFLALSLVSSVPSTPQSLHHTSSHSSSVFQTTRLFSQTLFLQQSFTYSPHLRQYLVTLSC